MSTTESALRPDSTRIELRQVCAADLPALFAHQADPIACRIAAFRPRDETAFSAHWRRILADPLVTIRAILLDGEVVGNIGSFERSAVRQVGYWIERAHWGRGIATAALSQFLRIDSVRPLFARVAVQNHGSLRVLEKCGLVVRRREHSPADERSEECEELILSLE